jgi:hypothetical protein
LIKFEMAKLTLESGNILVARVSGELSADFVSQVQYRRLAAQPRRAAIRRQRCAGRAGA